MADTSLIILTGSTSGTAEFVADELADALSAQGVLNRIVPMRKAALAMFATRKRFLIVSSTYGVGDVPDNGQPFYNALIDQRPDLAGVAYEVVGLGDMTYSESFCGGSARLDAIFTELGAQRIGERMMHDRRSGKFPEASAHAWLQTWLPLYNANRVQS